IFMKKEKTGDTTRAVLKYIKSYRIFIAISLLFAVVTVVLTLYLPILTGDAVDFMIEKGRVDFKSLAALIIKMAVIICITGVAQWIMNICN
ncbi:MAG TPA: sugar ABC transporter ATP-binding protein, partial [Lachnospiraceae bacterium]|nr:sugar ABC transporter ATP-binding protein [Lachnospiraceae bacterium]